MFILPPMVVLQLTDRRLLSVGNIPLIGTAVFGILVSLIGFVLAIYNVLYGDFCMHGQEPSYCIEPGVPWQLLNDTLPYTPASIYTLADGL